MVIANADFEQIYQKDLVYVPDCWKLCGDAHCCSFARYKSRFRLIAQTSFQEIPLLPGEYQFLESKNWLTQFGDFDYKVVEYAIDGGVVRAESVVSRRPNCACDHDTRPTICRLYPLLPVFDITGRLIGTELLGIYEELEQIDQMAPACQLTSLPFDQIKGFLAITSQLGLSPISLFYIEAYRLTKRHVADRLAQRRPTAKGDAFTLFESGFIRRNLIDQDLLRGQLGELARSFQQHYGNAISLA